MVEPLENMEVTKIFALYDPEDGSTSRLVRRLDGAIRMIADYVFVPVECWRTGERLAPRMDLLHLLNEMEVLAWAAN